jgi:hypothetical protein
MFIVCLLSISASARAGRFLPAIYVLSPDLVTMDNLMITPLRVAQRTPFGTSSGANAKELRGNLCAAKKPVRTVIGGQVYILKVRCNYTKIHGQAAAESDLERCFQVSPPAIHEMIKTLERNGLVERTPGQARSIRLLVRPEHLPRLE